MLTQYQSWMKSLPDRQAVLDTCNSADGRANSSACKSVASKPVAKSAGKLSTMKAVFAAAAKLEKLKTRALFSEC